MINGCPVHIRPRKDGTFELRDSKRKDGKVKTRTLVYMGKCPTVETAYWHFTEQLKRPKQPKETVLQADKRRLSAKHNVLALEKYRTPEDKAKAEIVRRLVDKMKEDATEKNARVSGHQFALAWQRHLADAEANYKVGEVRPLLKPTKNDERVVRALLQAKDDAFRLMLFEITAPIMRPIRAEQGRAAAEKKATAERKTAELKAIAAEARAQEERQPTQSKADWMTKLESTLATIEAHKGNGNLTKLAQLHFRASQIYKLLHSYFPVATA